MNDETRRKAEAAFRDAAPSTSAAHAALRAHFRDHPSPQYESSRNARTMVPHGGMNRAQRRAAKRGADE